MVTEDTQVKLEIQRRLQCLRSLSEANGEINRLLGILRSISSANEFYDHPARGRISALVREALEE